MLLFVMKLPGCTMFPGEADVRVSFIAIMSC